MSEPLSRIVCCMVVVAASGIPCAVADDWPQWRGPDRNGVWSETGIVERFAGPKLEADWRIKISNGYSGPTVADGRVYLTDRVAEPEQLERVLCVDAATGERLWDFEYSCVYERVGYPDGPRASVSIANGRAYALGAMGHLHCLDAKTGALLWKKTPGEDYEVETPIWGIASAPLVVDELVIVQLGGRPDACVVALDVASGREVWRALSDQASYSAPILIKQANQDVVVCWTGENVVGLDLKTGAVHWKHETPAARMIINVPSPVVVGERLMLTSFYDGMYLFDLPSDKLTAELLWARRGRNERRTDALHSTISTPLILGDYIYGVDSYGQFRCLEMATGDRVWESEDVVPVERWATVHLVRNGERIWMFNDQGELIIATLSPKGYNEISRTKLIEPTLGQLSRGAGVSWSHPAFANKHVFIRNDNELISANLAAE